MNLELKNKIDNFITNFMQQNSLASKIIDDLHQAGGTAVLVGGAVRDLFLETVNNNFENINFATKDFDIEIYGLEPDQVEKILHKYGPVQQIGKAFGVFLLPGLNIDWSLPRTDSAGRKPHVRISPNLDFKTAFRRRDLTINALGVNLKTGKLIDEFDGLKDLNHKILRYVDRDLFIQDPLRLYRVMQFVGRFEMIPDQDLDKLCSQMDISSVSKERIEQEFNKLFLQSNKPSLGLEWLKQIGRLNLILPELFMTIGVPQNPAWHPEGDVFEHTKQALDIAAKLNYDNKQEKLMIMWVALCHDLGKITTTKLIDGKWRSLGHASAGVPWAKSLLKGVTTNQKLILAVCKLVRYHMEPIQFVRNQAGLSAYKKLAINLYPQTIASLAKLVLADKMGRSLTVDNLPNQIDFEQNIELLEFIKQAKLANVWDKIEAPVLQGRDMLELIKPGPKLGELLKQAYLIQLEEGLVDKDILKLRILKKN